MSFDSILDELREVYPGLYVLDGSYNMKDQLICKSIINHPDRQYSFTLDSDRKFTVDLFIAPPYDIVQKIIVLIGKENFYSKIFAFPKPIALFYEDFNQLIFQDYDNILNNINDEILKITNLKIIDFITKHFKNYKIINPPDKIKNLLAFI